MRFFFFFMSKICLAIAKRFPSHYYQNLYISVKSWHVWVISSLAFLLTASLSLCQKERWTNSFRGVWVHVFRICLMCFSHNENLFFIWLSYSDVVVKDQVFIWFPSWIHASVLLSYCFAWHMNERLPLYHAHTLTNKHFCLGWFELWGWWVLGIDYGCWPHDLAVLFSALSNICLKWNYGLFWLLFFFFFFLRRFC